MIESLVLRPSPADADTLREPLCRFRREAFAAHRTPQHEEAVRAFIEKRSPRFA